MGIVDSYVSKYGSINDLKAKAFDLKTELKESEKSLNATEDIPAEYASITDPENHLANLNTILDYKQKACNEARDAKIVAETNLDGVWQKWKRGKNSTDDDLFLW